jgi:murein DD-endopeptidase MepM/ murein hydrolase activator NlpD
MTTVEELYYEGNCVIGDHGQRFFTIYMHLSKMEVKVGDRLKKGQRVGLSGKTGRVTGRTCTWACDGTGRFSIRWSC